MKIVATVIITIISVILFAQWLKPDEKPQYITFSAEKLKETLDTLADKNITGFKISAVLSAVDSDGQNIKIDLSAPVKSSRDFSKNDKQQTAGIREPKIIDTLTMKARAIFSDDIPCASDADIYKHPGIPIPPPGRCRDGNRGVVGAGPLAGYWPDRHCHCFDPVY